MPSLPHDDPPSSTTCPVCGCAAHAAPRTWEARCFVCQELRWPYQVEAPGEFWTCPRCQATGPGKRERRKAGVLRGWETRHQRGPVTS
jgi:hypothetical protein